MESTNSVQDRKWILFTICTILVAAWFILTFVPVIWSQGTVRLLADPIDRLAYFRRGQWFIQNSPAISEYPQVPTYLFGLNRLVSIWFDQSIQAQIYAAFFSMEMFVVLFFTTDLLLKLLPAVARNRTFFMLLPPAIYFVYNRFDILPAFISLGAFYFASRKSWGIAAVMLSIGTFTKWYPILLLPGYLFYAWKLERRFQWKMVLAFMVTSALILLPTLIQGDWDSLLYPYLFHPSRGMEYTALPVLLSSVLKAVFNISTNSSLLFTTFFALQLLGPLLTFFPGIDSLEGLSDYCVVSIGFFVLFSRIYSPQWMLWLLPFLILSARNRSDLLLMTIYTCLCYLGFPLFFDLYGRESIQLRIASFFMLLSLSSILTLKIRRLIKLTRPSVLSRRPSRNLNVPIQQ